jgi:hypothetical protein
VANLKKLGPTVTNKNYIHGEIKSRLILRNAFYHSVQNRLSCHLLSNNIKIKYANILPIFCMRMKILLLQFKGKMYIECLVMGCEGEHLKEEVSKE